MHGSGIVEPEQDPPTLQGGGRPEKALDCNPQLLVIDCQGIGLRPPGCKVFRPRLDCNAAVPTQMA
eukprot:4994719-Pyramimonas_sp.AAC.1